MKHFITMEYLSDNDFLQFHSNTLETMRKLHGFNSQKEINDAIDILDTWAKTQDHFQENNFGNYYVLFIIFFVCSVIIITIKNYLLQKDQKRVFENDNISHIHWHYFVFKKDKAS